MNEADLERMREQLTNALTVNKIPASMYYSIIEYILVGRPTGGFLTAVFSNDLKNAVSRGDLHNQEALVGYVKFLYNSAPAGCWGDPESVKSWMVRGGLKGITEAGNGQQEDSAVRES